MVGKVMKLEWLLNSNWKIVVKFRLHFISLSDIINHFALKHPVNRR